MDVFSRAKAQPSSRTGLGEAEESGRSLLHESLACSTVLHSECATFEHLTEMECTWRFASTMNGTKSGLSYETSCFGAMIKSKQATKVYFPAMVFKKWEQDCTLVSMLVTLLHLHQREPPTHTKYNHFSTLQKMPDAKKNSQSQHGRRARREKLGGIQHLVWRCPINCCDAFVHGSKDKTFAEGTRAPWQYSFAH